MDQADQAPPEALQTPPAYVVRALEAEILGMAQADFGLREQLVGLRATVAFQADVIRALREQIQRMGAGGPEEPPEPDEPAEERAEDPPEHPHEHQHEAAGIGLPRHDGGPYDAEGIPM